MRAQLAGQVDFVLERDRHPQERPLLPSLQSRLGLLRLEQRPLGEHDAERVERRVEALDPIEVKPHQLGRRDLPGPYHLGLPRRPREGDLLIGPSALSRHRRILNRRPGSGLGGLGLGGAGAVEVKVGQDPLQPGRHPPVPSA